MGLLTSDAIPADRTVYFGIISDGVHTHPSALRIAHRAHPNGLILVTDAISALGFSDGIHYVGQFAIEIRSKKAFIAGTDTLCGSIAPMDECVRIFKHSTGTFALDCNWELVRFMFIEFSDCSVEYALEVASLHPAKCLNIDKQKGTLNYGADADFVMLSSDLTILSTWISGECVYDAMVKV